MCGIIGIEGSARAPRLAATGLFALQHRGQEAAGIAASDGRSLAVRTGLGLVADAFPDGALDGLKGASAVGHVRYATSGDGDLRNAQPLVFEHVHGPLAISHNGNLTNAMQIRRKLEKRGAIFRTSSDSEVIVHLTARHPGPVEDAVIAALRQVEGAFSCLFLTPTKLIAVRDPLGFRPLVMGRLGKARVFASETTALDLLGARVERDLEPGEMVIVEGGRLRSLKPFPPRGRRAFCVFEKVYFARPDSVFDGRTVQMDRQSLGAELARQMKGARADCVVPVPDSGVPHAIGFAREAGIPYEVGFVRNHYIGRTFIQPGQAARDMAVRLKLSPVRAALKGKRIVLIDDSIVRGTTSRRIIGLLRRVGVREVHMAIASPPIVAPCFYGIDTPSRAELIAATRSQESIRRFLGADSLTYLSLEGLLRATGGDASDTCTACFTARYPTPIPDFAEPGLLGSEAGGPAAAVAAAAAREKARDAALDDEEDVYL
ncbi:MAG: amidophosphoribosyltransferase [Elusimicrobia bacterium]|nr:amidophosphoribosyltransferase [Elusimicrobiota bacterium]